jgi:Fur family zinc uptake transcriptional regulator
MSHAEFPTLTKNEDIVLKALKKAARPLSAYQIMEQTTAKGVRAPQQIYRALQGLVAHRLIHRIETINAYLACHHAPHEHQAAFAVCTACGRVEEVPLGKTVASLTRAVSKTGFAVHATHLELSGLCAECQAKAKA